MLILELTQPYAVLLKHLSEWNKLILIARNITLYVNFDNNFHALLNKGAMYLNDYISYIYFLYSVFNYWHLITLGKFDWVVRYVIIVQYVQFWLRLAAVSYRGKKVRTAVYPAVRSVNKSRDTRNCVQNEPEYAICVLFATHVYYEALGIIVCALIWQIRHNYNRFDDGHCEVTGHRKMSALGTVGTMVTTHEISVLIRSFQGPNFFSVL